VNLLDATVAAIL